MFKGIFTISLFAFLVGDLNAQTENHFGEFTPDRTIELQIINEAQALHHCEKALNKMSKKNYDAALRQCNKAIEISPSGKIAIFLRGYITRTLDPTNTDSTDFIKARSLKADDLKTDQDQGATIKAMRALMLSESKGLDHCAHALKQFRAENFSTVIDKTNLAIASNPSCGTAYRLRGYAKILLNSVEDGCSDLHQAEILGDGTMWAKVATNHIARYCIPKP